MKDKETKKKFTANHSLSEGSAKAFFFLRHNNDIDHITPVLHKWLSTENIPTDVIITTKRDFLDDYRINLLKKFKNARIFFLNDMFKKFSATHLFNLVYFKYTTQLDSLFYKIPIFRKIANKIIRHIANQIFKDESKGIVVFDWITTYFVKQMVKIAKERGFITVSLPHGDAPYVNYMIANNDFNYRCLDQYKYSNIFDYVIVPNDLFYKRFENYLQKNRIKVFGSPRYCDEWVDIISKFITPFDIDGSDEKLKIVFFLRSTGFPIFWEEVIRTIKLIMQFPEIYLVVKNHPRSSQSRRLEREIIRVYPDIRQKFDKNLKFIYGEHSSSSLINWADIMLDLGTSVTWEAVKQKKPVIMPDYLHANYSTISFYFKESEIKCRDQLYDTLQKFMQNKNLVFYNENERKRFIEKVIDVPDKHVLERYCKFLKSCFKRIRIN